jgi:hypothetical protein
MKNSQRSSGLKTSMSHVPRCLLSRVGFFAGALRPTRPRGEFIAALANCAD